ncbi:glycosyltransferase family 2 protein [Oceaniglobus roseus]|uniref:glycosyltransferase family 2 protein n=1 Tax=Oceaniglobus roseus TaxID=1737570 RepID=UPI000C7ED1C1|nr:glycosyltransferase family 2 protein [Kandeliimicrobium roseum]
MLVSVVVPCMNEEDSIPALVERLARVIAPWRDRAEIVLVDDGSTDATWAAIEAARRSCPLVVGLRLSANRGHQIALTAGLRAARGERVFMLDADLQDPPELLGDMMGMMDRGYDVVYGRRAERQGETAFKRASAWAFYRALNLMSDVAIPRDTGDFRLVSRRALDAVLAMPERARFVRGMFAWAGFRQVGIEYARAPRALGETKYPLRKMIAFATDAMTAFSTRPLRFATRMSFAALGFSGLMMVYVAHSLIVYQTAPGWASVVLAISLFSGVQLLTLGILGEYIGRLYVEAKGRPLYFIAEDTRETEEAASAAPVPLRKLASA